MSRLWPTPPPHEPDFILRDPELIRQLAIMANDGECSIALRRIHDHAIAMGVTNELIDVWKHYCATRNA